jgi:hypothetical protein
MGFDTICIKGWRLGIWHTGTLLILNTRSIPDIPGILYVPGTLVILGLHLKNARSHRSLS